MKFIARIQLVPQNILRIVAIAMGVVGIVLIYNATAQLVVVIVDGQSFELHTHARTVGDVLHAADLNPAPEDWLSPHPDSQIQAGTIIELYRAFPIELQVDGETQIIYTHETAPANILAAANLRLYPGDRLWIDGQRFSDHTQALERRPIRLRVKRAVSIKLKEEDATTIIHSAAPTLGEALWEAGIVLREGDSLSPGPETPVTDLLEAHLKRSRSIVIDMDGSRIETRAVGPTVGEAMAEADVTLVGMDYTQPNMADPLPEDGYVRVIRVREKVIVEMEPVQFGTVYQGDPTVEIDNFSLIDAGTLGVRATRILLRLEDGEEVDRVVEETVEVLEPKPRIVGYGTKIVVRTMNTPDGPVEYWRAVSMYATAYSPCNSAADRCYPNTSSGKPVVKGVVAFVRRWYLQMKGWPLYVPDYGFATVEDVGGGIPGRYWIDLGFSDDDIVSWHQWVTVYFLTPVPPADAIPWILN
jgi:uncharacterized protein YabE (DUF348 family)